MIIGRRSGIIDSRFERSNAPIQQIKAAGITARGVSTQGLPQIVRNVSISVARSGANRTLRISFTQNPSDHYFGYAQAYIKQGNGALTLLASGTSPIVVTLQKSNTPAIVTVVSAGNWGTTKLSASPGRAVSLA